MDAEIRRAMLSVGELTSLSFIVLNDCPWLRIIKIAVALRTQVRIALDYPREPTFC